MKGSVMVIGAGPAGMRASSELLKTGFKVFLVEERPTIGGKMAQLDKMFPTNECATCTALPTMLELTSNPNLAPLAFTEVVSVEGSPGDFKVKLLKKPRYVDPMKCNACTACFPACPVGGVPMEFNFGRGASKAIMFYSPFPPRKALIDPKRCNYLLKGKCGDGERPPCVEACKTDAIAFGQKPQEVSVNVGAIILATGADEVKDPALMGAYGYGKSPDVLTALEYERLLSGLGPTGGLVKRADGSEPRKLAWVVLVGPTSLGLLIAAAQALGTIEKAPQAETIVIGGSMEPDNDSWAAFLADCKERGVRFARAGSVTVDAGGSGGLRVHYDAEGGKAELVPDMLVLVPPLAAPEGARALAGRLGLGTDAMGFVKAAPGDPRPVLTSRPGIFVCGAAGGTKGIEVSVVEACSAAANAAVLLAPARGTELVQPQKAAPLPVKAGDEPSIGVVICRCGPNVAGLLDLEELVKDAEAMPGVKQVEVTPFGCDGVAVKRLVSSGKFNRILVGGCSPKTHEALFEQHASAAGLNRHLVEIVNLRNHCTWVHSQDRPAATRKAKTLMRMGAARASLLEPLDDIVVPVTPRALVLGCTPAGMAAALALARTGLEVHVVDSEPAPRDLAENRGPAARALFDGAAGNPKVRVHAGSRIESVGGFVGNYEAVIAGKGGTEKVAVGAVVVATERRMGTGPEGADYEAELALARNDRGRFVPMLGILNILDSNTEGVFLCGPARAAMGETAMIVDGEAAASRALGILSSDRLVKSPRTSVVVDENCDGCAYCVEPCPARAITLIEYMHEGAVKKTVEVNEAVCRGCGICMATCPKKGIYIRHFRPEQFDAMVNVLGGVI